jgi:phenylalanine-4-hydroxylase
MRSRTEALSLAVGNDAIPYEFRDHLVSQRHEEYTEADHAVWREVLARNEHLLERYTRWVPQAYLEGMRELQLPARVPRIEEINERVKSTGWRTVCVDGYIPSAAYVGLMSQSVFPISRSIRRPEHVDYAPAPDLVHDILGHLPLLFSAEHREFLRKLATVMSMAEPSDLDAELYDANRHMSALKTAPGSPPDEISAAEERVFRVHRDLAKSASELTHLARMYLWSIEFGLLGAADSFQVYGAALLSAPSEFRAVCEGTPDIRPYSVDVVKYDIEFSDLQMRYFVARDFEHLDEALTDYEFTMRHRTSDRRESGIRDLIGGAARRAQDD